jgi:hypothetical protein
MAFNVANFASNIARYGTLQTNKFEVRFYDRGAVELGLGATTAETIMNNLNLSDIEKQSFREGRSILDKRVDSVKLPGATIDTYESRRYGVGPNIKVGTNIRMEPFSISVMADKEYSLYKYFYTWLNAVFDFSGSTTNNRFPSYTTTYKKEYIMDAEVSVYENTGQPKINYRFFDCFPVGITDPSLSWRDNNNLLKFDVTFAYTDWEINKVFLSNTVIINN